jgi:hypothetical protein
VNIPYLTLYAEGYGCAVAISGKGYVNIVLLFQSYRMEVQVLEGIAFLSVIWVIC